MKIFLAGCEDKQFIHLTDVAEIKNTLFSYFHWKKVSQETKDYQKQTVKEKKMEVICDSGLFTLMFGAGKGGNYDLNYMKQYTCEYIKTLKGFDLPNTTIVESDVHKLLGMPAVFELRKYFEDSGMNVLYVWHKEEGIDGLMRMAEKYKYIALSIPELRVILKDSKQRYQTVTHNLLRDIRKHCGSKIPKIHLLGNTVQETMETSIAYSCDSTSWLSGGRFGTVLDFENGKLKQMRRSSEKFKEWKNSVYPKYENKALLMASTYGHNPKYHDYQISNLYSAMTMRRYQDHLDKLFPWIGLKNEK